MDTIKIKYVGKKPAATDNVAGSRVTWDGPGDVKEVTVAQAKTLLKYPDQWALVNSSDVGRLSAPVTIGVKDDDGTLAVVNTEELGRPLEKMSKPELVALAKSKFGKDLDASKPKKLLIDEIEEFEQTVAPVKK